MKKYYKYLIATTVASISTLGSFYYIKKDKNLLASWTNNYEPSVKWNHNWDRRAPASLIKPLSRSATSLTQNLENKATDPAQKSKDDFEINKKTTKATRHLFLIRHGQYEIKANEPELRVLTKLGQEQAKLTGDRLNELASKINISKMHKSTMIRAVQTADIIKGQLSKDLPISIDPLLCEGAPIPPEPPVGHWKPELYFYEDGSRIEAAYRKYFYRAPPEQLEDSYEIVVCHANVIRYFFCRALQFPAEAWLRFDLAHGSITHIHIRPDGRVGCRGLGESGFLPINKVSR